MSLNNLLLIIEEKCPFVSAVVNFKLTRKYNEEVLAFLEQGEPSALKNTIGEIYHNLCTKLEAATNEDARNVIRNGNMTINYGDMTDILRLLSCYGMKGEIDLEVLQLLNDVSFCDIVEDNRIINAVSNNSLHLSSTVYLTDTSDMKANHRFAKLLFENDKYYLLSFDENRDLVYKEQAWPTAYGDPTECYCLIDSRNSIYRPINKMFPKENMRPLHSYENFEGQKYIVMGECRTTNNLVNGCRILSHYICAKDGQILSTYCGSLLNTAMYPADYAQEEAELSAMYPEHTDYDVVMQTIEAQMSQNLENYRNATRN